MFRVEAELDIGTDFDGGDGPDGRGGNGEGEDGRNADDAGTAPDRIETLLQNAETIKIATREGQKAVTDLEAGDEVLVYYEPGGRHFGEAVEESIIEQ
jgi:3-dehydroquinate synthase II